MVTFWTVLTSQQAQRNNLLCSIFKEQNRLYFITVGIVVTRVKHGISTDTVFRIQIKRVRDDTPRRDMFTDPLLSTAAINNTLQLLLWLRLTISKPVATRPAVFHFQRLQTAIRYGTAHHKLINHNTSYTTLG
jgi:hypothetical protein